MTFAAANLAQTTKSKLLPSVVAAIPHAAARGRGNKTDPGNQM